MLYIHIKKIQEKLSNSLVFLVTVCILLGFVCGMIAFVQVPDYVNMVKDGIANKNRRELTMALEQLQENYYDNSRDFYVTYMESPFYNWGDGIDIDKPIYEYTDDDIQYYTMNRYFAKYLKEDLVSNDQIAFSTEVSTFIRIYEDTLLENAEIAEVMSDRKILQGAISDVVGQLEAIPKSTRK